MKCNRSFWIIIVFLSFLLFGSLFGLGFVQTAPDPSSWKKDGLPLIISAEWDDISYLLDYLSGFSTASLQQQSLGSVGFISLNRQSRAFRGKTVTIKGRLLFSQYHPIETSNQNFPLEYSGYYESWILLDDEKSIPLRLISRTIPDLKLLKKAPLQDNRLYRRDMIHATGVYYRLTAYGDGKDFYNAPLLVAFGFELIQGESISEAENSPETTSTWKMRAGLVLALIIFWLFIRNITRRRSRLTLFIGGVLTLFTGGSVFSSENLTEGRFSKPIFQQSSILQVPYFKEDAGGTPAFPVGFESHGQRDAILLFLERLGRTSDPLRWEDAIEPLLKTSLQTQKDFLTHFDQYKEQAFPFRGTLRSVQMIEWLDSSILSSEKEQKILLYRVEIEPEDDLKATIPLIIVYSNRVPDFQINRKGLLAGVNGTLTLSNNNTSASKKFGVGETVFGIGWYMANQEGTTKVPVLVAAGLQWSPENHLLGRLGMAVNLLEMVPVFSPQLVGLVGQKTSSNKPVLPESLSKEILTSLRFTKEDRLPFYSMLAAVSRASPSLLREEAMRNPFNEESDSRTFPVVELFNRPEQHQGELVLLHGMVRRAQLVPITDQEIVHRFGMDHYYQLYLYTNDSQGNPLVISVPTLPKGMPIGANDDYREEVSLAAFFYKTWSYTVTSSAEMSSSFPDNDDKKHWIRVPTLIGGDIQWYPQESSQEPSDSFPWQFYRTLLILLLVLYVSYRLLGYARIKR